MDWIVAIGAFVPETNGLFNIKCFTAAKTYVHIHLQGYKFSFGMFVPFESPVFFFLNTTM